MPSLLVPSVLFYRNPSFRPGLAAVVAVLMERDYTSFAIGKVFDHLATQGTTAGCTYLDREDEEAVEAAFVDNLPELPAASGAWDRDTSVIFDVEMLAEGNHPFPIPACDDDRDFEPAEEDWRWLESLDREAPMYGYE
jgi:hypothetical protein